MGLALAALAIIVSWLTPRPVGDLFMALAGGRDVVAGALGRPDTWSFATHGAIWINQNWGAGLILYIVYTVAGETGLLALKLLLIAACALFTAKSLIARGTPRAVSIVLTALCILGISRYCDLRPNLFSLVMVPLFLWIIAISERKPHYIWLTVPLEMLWANVHGGFVIGLALLAVWAGASCVASAAIDKKPFTLRSATYIIAFVAACMVVCIGPFGLKNLTFPFDMVSPTIWKGVREWRPIWAPEKGPLPGYVFIAFTIVLYAVLAWRLACWARKRGRPGRKFPESDGAPQDQGLQTMLFDICIAVGATAMAVSSKRFIPLSILSTMPLFSVQVRWAVWRLKWKSFYFSGACLALAGSALLLVDRAPYYQARGPDLTKSTIFEKMHRTNFVFPAQCAAFIDANSITGNMLNFWDWEGFLRWKCPGVKVFVGGRAQQIYTAQACSTYLDLMYGRCDIGKLGENGIHLILLPQIGKESKRIVEKAVNEGDWIVVYQDAVSLLLVDYAWAPARQLVKRAGEEKLVYPNGFAQAKSLGVMASCLTYKKNRALSPK